MTVLLVLDGINRFSDGMQKYINGMKAFKDGLEQFSTGAGKLDEGASALKGGLSELTKQNDSIIAGAMAIQQATFDSVNSQLAGMGLGIPALTPENYSAILSSIPNLDQSKNSWMGWFSLHRG